ncbi:glycosyltransferase [Actinomycetospora cinnamomea]|uniref:4,4'-diaponeurosporenoate glycosyltransferase n=1 Tax=Actinomycetospora cinnamomea TaxID=663609 RepID=A0A2U1E9Z9_9PSEU|nr:glycosyltransferase [Actinomycetospora cinnamomea]PVY96720.1 glycosyl transferase family 2 [Actinomycetospora cinnamomea]
MTELDLVVPRGRPVLGVVVPAHDEEDLLGDCLAGLRTAARAVGDRARVDVVVVADACTDRTERVARRHHVGVLRLAARNVGRARAAGADLLLSRREEPATWIATTDADSVVPPGWLVAQLDACEAGADAWVGTVEVEDWSGLAGPVRARYGDLYADGTVGDGHRHVHGANLGVAAPAYRAVGGFPPLDTGEDVTLVRRLDDDGRRVVRDRAHPVRTSARTVGRAPAGFASHLRVLSEMHVIPTSPGTLPAEPRCSRRRGHEGGPAARIS